MLLEMDSVAVTVPLRQPTKKMKKRKELDALAPPHTVSRRSSGKRSSQVRKFVYRAVGPFYECIWTKFQFLSHTCTYHGDSVTARCSEPGIFYRDLDTIFDAFLLVDLTN